MSVCMSLCECISIGRIKQVSSRSSHSMEKDSRIGNCVSRLRNKRSNVAVQRSDLVKLSFGHANPRETFILYGNVTLPRFQSIIKVGVCHEFKC